jgi:hypothetical protein
VKNTFLFIIVFVLSQSYLVAQNPNVESAHEAFKVAEYFKAKKYVDIAFKDSTLKRDPYSSFIRARIYQKLFSEVKEQAEAKLFRAESLTSYIDCKNNNSDSVRARIVNDQLSYLANSFYDEAITKLDTINYYAAIDAYDNYQVASKVGDSSKLTKSKVIDFHSKLAGIFEMLYNNNPNRDDILSLSKVSYMRVLNEDEKNPKMNYLMGNLYLLEAKKLQAKHDSIKAYEVLSQGLAYMQTAYYLASKNIDVINSMAKMYEMMKEVQKASDYKLIAEQVLKSGNSVKF